MQITDRDDDEQNQIMPWCGGVSSQEAYNLEHNSESSSSSDATGTSSETSSDYGEDEADGTAVQTDPAEIFWQYKKAKRMWRRAARKPVRKFRRHVKRYFKKRFFRKYPKVGRGTPTGFKPRRRQFNKGWKRDKVFLAQQEWLNSYINLKKRS